MDGKLTKPQKEGFAIICQDKEGNLINNVYKVRWWLWGIFQK